MGLFINLVSIVMILMPFKQIKFPGSQSTVLGVISSDLMSACFTARDVVQPEMAAKLLQKYGSPLYVYRTSIMKEKVNRLLKAADGFKISYALKANTNRYIVSVLKETGVCHVDVVSPGQIHKALQVGFEPSQIMYTENFISEEEMTYALEKGVTLNIGALSTLQHFGEQLAGKKIFIRINPELGAGSSYHVVTGGPKSKFGIYYHDLEAVMETAKKHGIHIVGLHQHIGSNMKKKDKDAILKAMQYTFDLVELFPEVKEVNIGGGLGVVYKEGEEVTDPQELYDQVRLMQKDCENKVGRDIKISIEPGRYLVADSGVLLCRITSTKRTSEMNFIGTDTGFNHLMRPALYGSHHNVINLSSSHSQSQVSQVCGNICESTDILGTNIKLGGRIGDILAIENAGAYGFSMASNYNERPKPAEVLIGEGNEDVLVRRRQTFEDLLEKD